MRSELALKSRPMRPSNMGDVNAGTVLDIIRHRHPISRADIARATRLSPTAVSNIVANLVERNLVTETLAPTSGLGRRAILLQFNPDASHVAGIDLDRDSLEVGITNLEGRLVCNRSRHLPETATVTEVVDSVEELLSDLRQGHVSQIIGIGLGVPSAVCYEEGVLTLPALPNLREAPLRRLLEERYGVPVHLENDAKAAALAEYRLLPRDEVHNLIYVKLGEGIGAGLVLNGALYRGAKGVAGNIGHVKLPHGRQPCNCGNVGCLEAEVGGRALATRFAATRHTADAGKPAQAAPALQRFIAAVQGGDEVAIALAAEAGETVGQVLAVLVRALDVDEVVIGGALSHCGEILLGPLCQVLKEAAPQNDKGPGVVLSRLRQAPGVVAAASLALDAFLASPR